MCSPQICVENLNTYQQQACSLLPFKSNIVHSLLNAHFLKLREQHVSTAQNEPKFKHVFMDQNEPKKKMNFLKVNN